MSRRFSVIILCAGPALVSFGCKNSFIEASDQYLRSKCANVVADLCMPNDQKKPSPSPVIGDLFSNLTLTLSSNSVISGESITVTLTATASDSTTTLQGLGVSFISSGGDFSPTTYPSKNVAETVYTSVAAGEILISARIAGKRYPGVEANLSVQPILSMWRDSLPAIFATDQAFSSYYTFGAEVASAPNGDAIVVWVQYDGFKAAVFKSERRSGTWSHPISLADNISPDGQNVFHPKVAMDPSGNAVIVWAQNNGANDQVFLSEYRANVWIHPSGLSDSISPSGRDAGYPQVAMDGLGNTVVVWAQNDGVSDQVFKSEYRAGGWSHPADLTDNISPDGVSVGSPEVAMGDDGTSIIVWSGYPGGLGQIFISEYRAGSWTHPSGPSDNISVDGQSADMPAVAVDSSGSVVVVWSQLDGTDRQIFKSEYRSGSWTHPSNLADNISVDGEPASLPKVAMDSNGDAIVVWHQSDSSSWRQQIFMSEYRAGSWAHPANVDDHISPAGGQGARNPNVAMDGNGEAIIAWHQNDGTNDQIFMSEYRSGSWTHPSGLADNVSPDGPYAYNPSVAMSLSGTVVVAWDQKDAANVGQTYVSLYESGSWTHPSNLSDNISPKGRIAFDPKIVSNGNGRALIAWTLRNGTYQKIFISEYDSGTWSHPASYADAISPDGSDAYSPQIAMDNSDNALVVWYQNDGSVNQVFVSEYRSGNWTHPANLADNISPDGQSAYYTHVSMDANGDALVTWQQSDGTNSQIFMSEYRSGSWTHPANLADNISPDGQHAVGPRSAMSASGEALIVWQQNNGTTYHVFMSEYRLGAWIHPSNLTENISPNGQQAGAPKVAMDGSGNALVVWDQSDGSKTQIFLSEYRSGSWDHPTSLTDNISPDGQHAALPMLVMNDRGDSLVVWQQNDGSRDQIFRSEYRLDKWQHPSSLSDNISPNDDNFLSPFAVLGGNGEALVVAVSADRKLFTMEYQGGTWHNSTITNQANGPNNYCAEFIGTTPQIIYSTATSHLREIGIRIVEKE